MRLYLLNQFGADSGAPTGRIVGELGAELQRRGHQVRILSTDSSYGKPRRGVRRLVQEILSHLFLLGRGLGGPRPDGIVSLTSPACLAVTAGLLARLRGTRHFHWAMDLYPDVGVRLGELRDGPSVGFYRFLMRRAYREADRVIALDEDMRDYLREHYGVEASVVGPFPPDVAWPPAEAKISSAGQWLYSGNFGRAHEIEILLQVQKRLEERGVAASLILQGQGPQFESSRESAARLGLRQVQWRPPVSREKLAESLLESDVLVVTRKADLRGLLLPSKLILAELSGRSVLWIGDTDGKTARRLAAQERHGVFKVDDVEPIAVWLQRLFEGKIPHAAVEPMSTGLVRRRDVDELESIFTKGRALPP